jgi:GntR family transcriptional regulator/MocR family aminotransferase
VEDDYDSEYRYKGRPLEAIQALDPDGRTIYLGTLSKVLFPALRLGFLIVPGSLTHAFLGAKWIADRHSPTVLQAAIADYIQEGHFERHLRRTRAKNAERRTTLLEALQDLLGERIEVAGSNAGIHLLVWLRDFPTTKLTQLVEQASSKGVGLYPNPVTPYYLRPPRRAGLLFGYASLDVGEIREGVRRFATALEEVELSD